MGIPSWWRWMFRSLDVFRPEPGAPVIRSGTFQHCWCWTDPSRYNSFRIEYGMFFYINMLKCHSFTDVHYGNVLNRYFHKIHIYITLKKSHYGRMIQLCVLLQCNLEPFWFLLISIWDMEQPKQEPDANTKRFTGNLFFLLQIICHCFFVAIIRWNKSFFIIMWKSGEELSRNCGRHISRKVLFGTFSGTICINIGTKSRSVQFCACTGAHSACFTSKKNRNYYW